MALDGSAVRQPNLSRNKAFSISMYIVWLSRDRMECLIELGINSVWAGGTEGLLQCMAVLLYPGSC